MRTAEDILRDLVESWNVHSPCAPLIREAQGYFHFQKRMALVRRAELLRMRAECLEALLAEVDTSSPN